MAALRIAVVTPLFPTSVEPYRGQPIYQTVLALERHPEVEDVQVFCPLASFPRWRFLHPRSTRYSRVDLGYSPAGVRTRYLEYPALPLVSRPFNGRNCASVLRDPLRAARPDVILAYWLYPEGYAAILNGEDLGVPIIVGSRGSDLRQIPDPWSRRKTRDVLRRASFILTVSEDLRERAIALGCSPTGVRNITNGCDAAIFHPASRQEARAALGIDKQAQLVLFVGWLGSIKGVPELLEAAAQLASSHPHLQLALIGEGSLETQLRAQASQPGLSRRVQFLGRKNSSEVARWLAASDLLCLPSHTEGCPNVVLEALSCGRPVVATAVGGTPELLDPRCGILVPPRDPAQLAQALAQALRQSWDETAIAARFGRSWDQVAGETLEVCRKVLFASR